MDASSQRKCRAPSKNTAASVFRKSLRGGGRPAAGRQSGDAPSTRTSQLVATTARSRSQRQNRRTALYSPAAAL
jgi:hypothetical protein